MAVVYSIGHSNHPIDRFLGLLQQHAIDVIADVRTFPRSRRFPQFNQNSLIASLRTIAADYTFCGAELGGRPADPAVWRGNRPDYEAMAAAPLVQSALAALVSRATQSRLAMMCSEKEPLDCHRCLLLGRVLAEGGTEVRHILADGALEPHAATEDRLLAWANRRQPELFAGARARRDDAYRARAAWLWTGSRSPGAGKR